MDITFYKKRPSCDHVIKRDPGNVSSQAHAGKYMARVSSCLQVCFCNLSWIFSVEFIELQSRNFLSDYE